MAKTIKTKLALVTFLVVAGVFTSPAFAQQSPVVMRITGGATGKFIVTPHSLTTTGYSDVAADIKVREDGTAWGQFVCAVPNLIVISGQATNATVNSDGSVTVTGVGYGFVVGDDGGGFSDDSFFVTFRPGGPHLGGFDFADATFPEGMYDTEGITSGSIKFIH